MKNLLVACMLSAAPALVFAYHCPMDMKAIDAKLATKPMLSEADAAKVKQLRAEGETLHKAGKHDESVKALGEAKKILGI